MQNNAILPTTFFLLVENTLFIKISYLCEQGMDMDLLLLFINEYFKYKQIYKSCKMFSVLISGMVTNNRDNSH